MNKLLIVAHYKTGNRFSRITTDDKWCVRNNQLIVASWNSCEAFPSSGIPLDALTHYTVCRYFNTFSELLDASGKSMGQISGDYGIPYRTLQDWKAGVRQPPTYVLNMLTELINIPAN